MSTTTAGVPPTNLWPSETRQEARVRGYWGSVALRLSRDKATLIFGFILLLIVLMAVFEPLVAPFDLTKKASPVASSRSAGAAMRWAPMKSGETC